MHRRHQVPSTPDLTRLPFPSEARVAEGIPTAHCIEEDPERFSPTNVSTLALFGPMGGMAFLAGGRPDLPVAPKCAQRDTRDTQMLKAGSVAFAGVAAGGRIAQLTIDISGVHPVASLGVLRRIVADSWIVASHVLTGRIGELDLPLVIVRGLLMLIVTRVLRVPQLALLRETLGALNFVTLASAWLRSNSNDTVSREMSEVLRQIAAVPIIVYTAMARLMVETATDVREHLLRVLPLPPRAWLTYDARGQLGRNGKTLIKNWNALMDNNQELRDAVADRAPRFPGATMEAKLEAIRGAIQEWVQNFNA